MNEDPNNTQPGTSPFTQTGTNTAFSQHAMPNTNPFTGDLKGEFSSDFGTNTNAVSQIFKGNGFGAQDRTKTIIIAVVVLLILGGAFWYFTSGSESSEDETASEEQKTEEGAATEEGEGEDAAAEGEQDAATDAAPAETPAAEAAKPAQEAAPATASTGNMTLVSPAEGAQQTYDETMGPAEFRWEGQADKIVFSRHKSMTPVVREAKVTGKNAYMFNHPWPGHWYWHVVNSAGQSEVHSFVVDAPVRRNFPVKEPAAGAAISGNGGVVSWQADQKVARYQVQMSQPGSGWANPQYRFGTTGTTVALQGVAPGQYDMRVGAFSEVSGRWEWQVINGVTVQ